MDFRDFAIPIIFTPPSVSTLSAQTVVDSNQLLSTCRPRPRPAGEPGRARIVRFSRPGARTHTHPRGGSPPYHLHFNRLGLSARFHFHLPFPFAQNLTYRPQTLVMRSGKHRKWREELMRAQLANRG